MAAWLTVAKTLRTLLAAEPGYRLPDSGDDGVTVFVATQIELTEESGDWVCFAYRGDPDTATSPGTFDQTFGPAAPTTRPRDESGTIECRLVAQSGDTDEDVFDRAMGYLADVEALLRTGAGPDLGLVPSPFSRLVAHLTRAEPQPSLNRGSVVPVDFTITYAARL